MKRLLASILIASSSCLCMKAAGNVTNVPEEKDMKAYLMVYHKDEDHGLHMAISRDGRRFAALNDDNPVIAGDTIAMQKGIRDPHIYRGPDGAFYMTMTDLHVFGQRDGKRTTEWERPGEDYGWGNNRGIVMMKSWDLLNWTHTVLNFDTLFPAWREIGCAWAPETFYDDKAGKLMVHLTMRQRKDANKLYYVYVNKDFNAIESEPKVLFRHNDPKVSVIDGDITKVGDAYHLMYVSHERQAGIRHAVSDSPTGEWKVSDGYVDASPVGCEAPTVFKRIGEDVWVVMYDIYRQKPMTFGFVETTDFKTYKDLGEFNNGKMRMLNFYSPKHGAIVQITGEEADRLEKYWKENPKAYNAYRPVTEPNKANPVIEGFFADPEILYSEKTGRYYLYPTTDGAEEWRNHDAEVYSSADMKTWQHEGKALDLRTDVAWADSCLWAPCIIERKYGKGKKAKYKYFYYFVANGNIGVATADNPAGPFKDALGKPMIPNPESGPMRGHIIDPDVFHDPVSGKYYLYWGNSFLVCAELNDDMLSVKDETLTYVIPRGQQRKFHYNEASYVFYRNGKYYFMWSENDTRSTEYRVRYAMGDSPTAITGSVKDAIVLRKDPDRQIYGTGHHAVICKPGTDEWYIVYHRFQRPDGLKRGWSAGYYREVCIDRMHFNPDGTIKPVKPTL